MRDYSCHTLSSIIYASEKHVIFPFKVKGCERLCQEEWKYYVQPTVEEINQTTTLNQPFQIEFTVLPAKSDSESNLQDMIKTASSYVRCTVQVNV